MQRSIVPSSLFSAPSTQLERLRFGLLRDGLGRSFVGLLEHYGLVSIQQDAVFHVPADGARQDDFFDVAALLDQVVDGVAVVDADDILLDDGAIVEYLSNVVSGGADQLDAALKRLVVGFGADECGQERMVNVDQVLGAERGNELVREHLHVASENHQTALVFADERDLLLLRFPLAFLRDRHDEVGDAVKVGDPLVVGMIGNDQRNFAVQLTALLAKNEIGNGSHNPFAVGAGDKQDGGGGHGHFGFYQRPLRFSVCSVVQRILHHRDHSGPQGKTGRAALTSSAPWQS